MTEPPHSVPLPEVVDLTRVFSIFGGDFLGKLNEAYLEKFLTKLGARRVISDRFGHFGLIEVCFRSCKWMYIEFFFHFWANTEAQDMEAGPRRCIPWGVKSFIKTLCWWINCYGLLFFRLLLFNILISYFILLNSLIKTQLYYMFDTHKKQGNMYIKHKINK